MVLRVCASFGFFLRSLSPLRRSNGKKTAAYVRSLCVPMYVYVWVAGLV